MYIYIWGLAYTTSSISISSQICCDIRGKIPVKWDVGGHIDGEAMVMLVELDHFPKGPKIKNHWNHHLEISGNSWMYPYQRTPMGNPYISPIYPYIVGVYGLLSPRIPKKNAL